MLTSHQRGLITRYAKKVRHVTNLHPISASKAKKYRNLLFKPGIQAVRLRNTETNAKVFFGNDGMIVTSNGRKWVYWPLDYETASNQKGQLAGAAKKAFNKQFPIERAAKLAETAFKKLPVIAITLWTHAGRADQTFSSIEQFTLWMNDKWQAGRYVRVDDRDGHVVDETNSGAWIVGLAIRVE